MCTPGSKLNRSCSESDLNKVNFEVNSCSQDPDGFEKRGYFVAKRILFVEEVIHSDSSDIFRRGTNYHVIGRSTPDHLHNLGSLVVTNMVNNQFSNNSNSIHGPRDTTTRKKYTNYINKDGTVPMEIDTIHDIKPEDCIDFIETMDVDIEDDKNSRYTNLRNIIKKRNLCKPSESTNFSKRYLPGGNSVENRTTITPIVNLKKKDSKYSTCILMLVITFMLSLVYIVFFHDIILYVNSDVQYHNIEKDLIEKVHGQNASLEVIVRSLQKREHWNRKIKVLSFVGPTGVGKTFVANIIKKHFHQELAHELFGIHLHYESQRSKISNSLKSCCLNVIIIDDLKRKDTIELFAFIYSLPQDQFLLVLPIFNIQYTNDEIKHEIKYTDIVEIRDDFDNSGLYHELIIFKEFNNDQVKDWIKKQLNAYNIDLELQEQMLKSVLKGHEARSNGFKGLYPKILLELEKHVH